MDCIPFEKIMPSIDCCAGAVKPSLVSIRKRLDRWSRTHQWFESNGSMDKDSTIQPTFFMNWSVSVVSKSHGAAEMS